MISLDDLDSIARVDTEDVLGVVEGFADQCAAAWAIGKAATGLPDPDGVTSVLVLGMGGSGVSGEVVQSVVEPRLPLPFRVIKTYGPLPEWVGRNTLVFAVSYSGSTEETLAAVEDAHSRGARIVTVSSGGPLAELAEGYGIAHIAIPGGSQPRASLGYLTLPVLAALQVLGFVPDMDEDVVDAVEVLSDLAMRCDRKNPTSDNPAKDLADRIGDRIAVIYGSDGVGATAAMRFKSDLNEYGKVPAFWHHLPELDHNEIVGWNRLSDLTRDRFVLVLLRDPGEHPRVALRFDISKRLIEDQFAEVVEIEAEGATPLARVLSLILVTQLAAIYVGIAGEVDPGPVPVIQKLKSELAER